MKTCGRCEETKPVSDFYKHGRSKDGLRSECKPCGQLSHAEWRASNKSAVRLSWKKASLRKYYRQTYGLEVEERQDLFDKANRQCQLCEIPESELAIGLVIDHDHHTGTIRGVLCGSCNSALGLFKENVSVMLKAIGYIKAANSGNRVGS